MSTHVPLSPMVHLTIRHGKRAGQTFSASGPTVTIGRVSDNSIVIDDPQVSRHHASLTFEGGRWVLRDLGSTNGTTLNGKPVTAPVVVRNGDVIGLGEVMVGVQLVGAAGGEATAMGMRAPTARPAPAPAQPTAGSGARPSWVLPVVIFVLLIVALALTAALAFLLLRGSATPPQVVITSPPNGATVSPGQEVAVQVVAQDARGVTRIDLWVDNVLYASQSAPDARGQTSFAVVHRWVPNTPGSHALLAKAYNVNGQETLSPIVLVTVMQPTSEISQLPSPQAIEGLPPAPADTPAPLPPPTSAPLPVTPTPVPPPTPTTCTDDMAFVADVTVPDGTVVTPGQRIDKVWRLRNIGSCPWGPGYMAVFVSGNPMSAPPAVSIPNTPPGAVVDVAVTMYAPAAPGTHVSYWQLRNAAGVLFGRRFLIQVVVPAPVTPTPIPSPTPEASISFIADRTEVGPGECATLRWDVENVTAVYLNDSGVVGHGSQSVCPTTTTTYVLRVQLRDGSITERSITITVNLPEVPKPTQVGPPDGSVFHHSPRYVDFYWTEVSYPGGVTYTIEIQYGTPDGTDWQPYQKVEGLTEPRYRMEDFVGAGYMGRWRVWAVSNVTGQRSSRTGWWKFQFTM